MQSPSLKARGAQRRRTGHGSAGLRHRPGPPALHPWPLRVFRLRRKLRVRGVAHRCRGAARRAPALLKSPLGAGKGR